MIFYCEENINGGGYRHEALRKWYDCRGGGKVKVHVFLSRMMRCQLFGGMDCGDSIVIEGEYR